MSGTRRRVVVAGATGLVGEHATRELALRGDVEVVALVRKRDGRWPEGVVERVFDYASDRDFDALASERIDVLLCALGTTRRKAGSDEAFLHIDRDLPLRLVDVAKRAGDRTVFGLVSSVGADVGRGLYLSAKHAVEQRIFESGLPYVVVRPSLLLGDRRESRPGEAVAAAIGKPLFSALLAGFPSVARVAPIEAHVVAKALVAACLDAPPADAARSPRVVLEGEPLFAAGGARLVTV